MYFEMLLVERERTVNVDTRRTLTGRHTKVLRRLYRLSPQID